MFKLKFFVPTKTQICDRKIGKGIYEKCLDRTLKVLGTVRGETEPQPAF